MPAFPPKADIQSPRDYRWKLLIPIWTVWAAPPGRLQRGSEEGGKPMSKIPQEQVPGVSHRRVGDIVVTAISDGFVDGGLDVLRNIDQEEARRILAESFRPARRTAINAFLLYSAGRLALVETGSGNYLGPTAGKVLANITAAGVDPASIETVLLTHMHPDHSAGLSDPATGRRYFSNAELVVHENEPPHWFDDAAMAKASERQQRLYFMCAREQITP